MLEETVRRLHFFVPPDRILIVTNRDYQKAIQRILKRIPARNILTEPCPRNTAPALALAAHVISKRDPDAVFVALPADHAIRDKEGFARHMKLAAGLALKDKHVVFGIPPDRPHTGFGYIACKKKLSSHRGIEVYEGLRFVEKPPLWQAKAFVREGRHFWNSGIFVWKATFFL